MNVVVDNDILFKGASYGLLDEFTTVSAPTKEPVGILGAARYVVTKRIRRARLHCKKELVEQEFDRFLGTAIELEPTSEELELAVELERAAQELALALDAGESQLLAIVVVRNLRGLITGDKRAIASIERLLEPLPRLLEVCGKVRCLEQLVITVIDRLGISSIRARVCAEPEVDKALSSCFSCWTEEFDAASVSVGLNSYVRAVRHEAPHVLGP